MMRYIESPNTTGLTEGERGLFLAGGITDCPDWQRDMVEMLRATNWVLFNPRRENFPIHDPNAASFQIKWEHDHLRKADAILFWFPCETLCPIVLYELGAWSMTRKLLFVGVHPQYKRRKDVEVQTGLARPDVRVVYSLQDLAKDCAAALNSAGRALGVL